MVRGFDALMCSSLAGLTSLVIWLSSPLILHHKRAGKVTGRRVRGGKVKARRLRARRVMAEE